MTSNLFWEFKINDISLSIKLGLSKCNIIIGTSKLNSDQNFFRLLVSSEMFVKMRTDEFEDCRSYKSSNTCCNDEFIIFDEIHEDNLPEDKIHY